MQNPKEFRLQIGQFCCELRFKEANWATSVKEYYQGFLSEEEPDIFINLTVVPHQQWIELPCSLMIDRRVDGNHFDFHSGLLRGSLDLINKRAKVEVKYGLLKNARIFEQFFYHLYYTLLEERYPNEKPNNYLLHACAVDVGDQGYVFTGPSGSGKSTIGLLADNYNVLNDEMVIIGKRNVRYPYQVRSTPFNGEFKTKVNGSVPLKAIFCIRHGRSNFLRPLKPAEFVRFVLREVVVPLPLHTEYSAEHLFKMTDFCAQLVSEVPCYELSFVPDEGIWKFIELNVKR
ncbi:MAG: hypothetical protein JW786_00310 [Desulfobacterales bacterium]|nr:hypothetical protein [Desulfobacterales bacterium]